MASRIEGNPYHPLHNDSSEPMTPEQRVRMNAAKTPQQRIEALGKKSVNEVAEQRFLDQPLADEHSAIGGRVASFVATMTDHMRPGSRVALSAEAKLGDGVGASAKAGIDIELNEEGRYVLARSVEAGVEVAGHDAHGEAGVEVVAEWSELYEYDTLDGVRAGASTGIQAGVAVVADDLVDRSLDAQRQQLERHHVGQRIKVSSAFFAEAGVSAGPVGIDGEARLGSSSQLTVNEKTGKIVVESEVELEAKVSGLATTGIRNVGVGVARELAGASIKEKVETTFQMSPSEQKRWAGSHDLEVLADTLRRGPAAQKLVQHVEAFSGGQQFIAKREIELDDKTTFSRARQLEGIELSWKSGATTDTYSAGADLWIGAAKVQAKVEHPGMEVGKATVTEAGTLRRSSESELAAHRARFNAGH